MYIKNKTEKPLSELSQQRTLKDNPTSIWNSDDDC